jgi:hypothetical protein
LRHNIVIGILACNRNVFDQCDTSAGSADGSIMLKEAGYTLDKG